MKNYSIEKIGSDYVVKVDDQQVIKLGSRRRAAQLVVDASELLDEAPLAPDQPDVTAMESANHPASTADNAPMDGTDMVRSITRDGPEVA